ncbi:hypothetical protein RZS08_23950, partial [Arthrospira platensis SPKY1]|nr:hypothetical protein [Arthrospira platensis SPKY1]
MTSTARSMNTENYNINLSGNINIRTTETINLTFGGTYNTAKGNSFRYSASFFNWDKNTEYNNNTWRVFGRFTQRFPSSSESTSLVKNLYYSIQADYTRQMNSFGDPYHYENLF